MSEGGLAAAYSATGAAWQAGPARVYDRLAKVLVDRSPVRLAGRRVLDLGAGTGAASRAIAAAGGVAVRVDLALGMMQTVTPAGPGAVADVRCLPFTRHGADGAVAAFSLNHVPDPHVALLEAVRVLRPGSPVLASAYAADDEHPVKQAVEAAARDLGWEPEPWVAELRGQCIPVLATPAGARRAAEAAGIRRLRVERVEVAFPELGPDDLVAWRCGMAQLAPFVSQLALPARDRLRTSALARLGSAPPLVRRMVTICGVT